jgi:hypothetical protein
METGTTAEALYAYVFCYRSVVSVKYVEDGKAS